MRKTFKFRRPGRLVDGDLELALVRTTPADPVKHYVPEYEFEMRRLGKTIRLGSIRLRIGSASTLRYGGHIAYEVKRRFRGHRYAARSCRVLLPLARAHGLKAVWLTVAPQNIPSRRTCELLGAQYVETVRIPKAHEMYAQGARYRRRYRVDLRTKSNQTLETNSERIREQARRPAGQSDGLLAIYRSSGEFARPESIRGCSRRSTWNAVNVAGGGR